MKSIPSWVGERIDVLDVAHCVSSIIDADMEENDRRKRQRPRQERAEVERVGRSTLYRVLQDDDPGSPTV
ncbi:hypothetical protein ACWEPC_05930 [Nonomuraea sp. NPDC004297]